MVSLILGVAVVLDKLLSLTKKETYELLWYKKVTSKFISKTEREMLDELWYYHKIKGNNSNLKHKYGKL